MKKKQEKTAHKARYETRMYFFVHFSLSGIQKGIQAGHAAVEYARYFGDTEIFEYFAMYDKTFILLNGGTSNRHNIGTMEELFKSLKPICNVASFSEPDLNNSLTAMAFILDERVYDRETYPDFFEWIELPGIDAVNMRIKFGHLPDRSELPKRIALMYDLWIDQVIGTETNARLREIIRGKHLASN